MDLTSNTPEVEQMNELTSDPIIVETTDSSNHLVQYVDFSRLSTSPLFSSRGFYKPMNYQWAYDAYKTQNEMHWGPDEVPMADDLNDWSDKLNDSERNLLTHLFRFFVQGDIDIGNAYVGRYMKIFKNEELRMMMSSFASMEAVHVDAYSKLLETIGMPVTEYKAFYSFEEMKAKHDYLQNVELVTIKDVARNIAIYSMMTEGMQLYSSFAILMNFPRHGKMNNMGQIIAWSIRDEDHHARSMTRVFKQLVHDHPEILTDEFKADIYTTCTKMVDLEDHFIDLMFEQGDLENLTKLEIKDYIRFIANNRLHDAGLKKIFTKNYKDPLGWLSMMISSREANNFFETKGTGYAKGAMDLAGFKDVWA